MKALGLSRIREGVGEPYQRVTVDRDLHQGQHRLTQIAGSHK